MYIIYPRMLFVKFGLNWPCGFGEKDENVESLQTNGQTDYRWQMIKKANLNFQLRWANKELWVTNANWFMIRNQKFNNW